LSRVIHIVDDDAQVRAATSYLLTGQAYSTQVYSTGEEFLAEAKLGRGCILLDLRMPGLGGLDVMAELAARGVSVPVIMISGHGDLATAVQAMKLGAIDFLEKPFKASELIAAVERALDSGMKLRDQADAKAAAMLRLKRLSPRQRQILQGLLGGMTNKTIARRLALSPRTVEMHRANLMDDLSVASLSDALRLAIDAELTPLNEPQLEEPVQALSKAALNSDPPRRQTCLDGEVNPLLLDVLEGTTDCAFLLDRDWRFIYLNPNAAGTISRGRDLIGAVIWEVFPLAVGTRAWEQLQRAAADRQPARFEFFEPDLECWFDVSVRPVHTGLQVFFRDTTAERKINAALMMSEETLRLALETSGDGAWDWNISTGHIAMSPRFVQRLGYEPEALPASFETVRHLVHPDDWPVVMGRLSDHMEGRTEVFACEYRVRRTDGGWCWNFDRGRVVARDPVSGAPLRMVGTACDITDRKAEEVLAQEAFERIALAQENSGAGIWELDLDSQKLHLCARSLEMHGLPPDGPTELTAGDWESTVHPDDVTKTHQEMERAISTGSTYRVRYRTIDGERKNRWILGLGKLVEEGGGRPPRFVGLNLDETDQVESTLELKRVQSQLLHLSRLTAMGAVASMLSHELNQPLTAISAYMSGIRRSLEGCEDQDRTSLMNAVEGAEKSARYAAEVVRCLRDHAAQGEVEKGHESLTEIVDEARELCAEQFASRLAPIVEITPDADNVLVDRVQIEQVLVNLIRNAGEAMAESGSETAIAISGRRTADGFAEVRVKDSGNGLSAELKAQLFSPSPSQKPDGMGIGLSICRTIVEAHGGRIWAEDNDPCGACLCFTIPLASD
jgi:two-component system sensor kinase FixL